MMCFKTQTVINITVRGKPHWTMRLLIIILTFITCGQACSQHPDDYVKTIEKSRAKGKLTMKSSTDKTFVGSVRAYYDNGSLVLINSLSDAESAGTETLYYMQDGMLMKVFIMAATFDSNDEWMEYYSRHKSVDRCITCHGKPNCIVTEITIGDKSEITVTEKGKIRQLSRDEKTRIVAYLRETCEQLKVGLKEL